MSFPPSVLTIVSPEKQPLPQRILRRVGLCDGAGESEGAGDDVGEVGALLTDGVADGARGGQVDGRKLDNSQMPSLIQETRFATRV